MGLALGARVGFTIPGQRMELASGASVGLSFGAFVASDGSRRMELAFEVSTWC